MQRFFGAYSFGFLPTKDQVVLPKHSIEKHGKCNERLQYEDPNRGAERAWRVQRRRCGLSFPIGACRISMTCCNRAASGVSASRSRRGRPVGGQDVESTLAARQLGLRPGKPSMIVSLKCAHRWRVQRRRVCARSGPVGYQWRAARGR